MQRLNGWSLSDFSATNFWPNLANPANQRTCLSIIISSNALVNVSIVIIESSLKSNSQVCESHSLNKLGFQLPSKSNQNCVSCLVLIWGSFSSPDNRVIEQVAVTQNKKLCGQDEDKQANTDLQKISKSPDKRKTGEYDEASVLLVTGGASSSLLSAHGWGLHCDWWH